MAPFTNRQVGYIKAIAGVGQHKSFKHYRNDVGFLSPAHDSIYDNTGADESKFWVSPVTNLNVVPATGNINDVKKIGSLVFTLDNAPLTIDHNDVADSISSANLKRNKFNKQFGQVHPMGLLTMPANFESSETKNHPTRERIGEDYYLESTHVKFRFTMPDFTVASGKAPHHEYRWIVFRQRHPTLSSETDATASPMSFSWLNWNYDLFNGYQGRPVGPTGYRKRENFDGSAAYIEGAETTWAGLAESQLGFAPKLTADDLMTLPLNDADYVVMRDERFFLGQEHGKSHYETALHFDWSDAGTTHQANMVEGLKDNNKNYRWFFLLIGTTNGTDQPNLNIAVRGTTAITSA